MCEPHTLFLKLNFSRLALPGTFSLLAGGFAKAPGVPPDLLHTFYSLSWFSLAGETGVQAEMDVALGVTRGTAERLGRHRPISPGPRWKEQHSP